MKGQMLSWNIQSFPGRRQLRKSSLNSRNIPGDLSTHFRWRGSYSSYSNPRYYDLKQPILVINATDRDGTRPILKIDRNDIFMLVKATVISYQKFSKFRKK